MRVEQAPVLSQTALPGGYRILVLRAPGVAGEARPGQFVHVLVPRLDAAVLRRPFSLYEVSKGRLSILYKEVGKGTRAMTDLARGDEVSVMGPLGNGFPVPAASSLPVLVAGGYGVAPLYFLACSMKREGIVFIGGRTRGDILLAARFRAKGWTVRVATEDGSVGTKGYVTAALEEWMGGADPRAVELFACGPDGMLRAVGGLAMRQGWKAWLSLDKHMGCGVGACLACVQKIRKPDGSVVLLRVCRDGPIFNASEIVWGRESA